MTFCSSAGSGPTNSAPVTGRMAMISLHAQFGFTSRHEFSDRTAGELHLGRDCRGDPKLRQELRNIGAARAVAIGDGLSLQKRAPQRVDVADIGLRRAG